MYNMYMVIFKNIFPNFQLFTSDLFSHYIKYVFSLHAQLTTTDTPESSDSSLVVPQESSRQESHLPTTEEPSSQILSSLRLENQLLRSEVASLNKEMASVIQRSKDLQDGKILNKRKPT